MSLDRLVPTSSTPGAVTGDAYMDAVAEEFTGLWNRSLCTLTSIGGTGNAITATLDPPLTAGLVDGMSFWLTPAANNTGATTIAINGAGAVDIVNVDGAPLSSGNLATGRKYLLVADSGDLRIVTSSAVRGYNKRVYLASDTWSKPDGLIKIRVRVRGGGGGGGGKSNTNNTGVGGGGGGGGEAIVEVLAADLSATETVTVGAGGTAGGTTAGNRGGTGGTSSFGTDAVATGGTGGAVHGGDTGDPGIGGVGTAGDIKLRGSPGRGDVEGNLGFVAGAGGASPTGGMGGASPASAGSSNPGLANTGGGGSGGRDTTTNTELGAVGGSGMVEVEEFF